MMNGDSIFRWFPVIVAVLQLVFLPLVLISLNAQIDNRIGRHNDNLYAHPSLNDLRKLEEKIEYLAEAVNRLELRIAGLVPRRSTDMKEG